MINFKKGDVVLLPYPYSDDFSTAKVRPALIISNPDYGLDRFVGVQITSQLSNNEYSYRISKNEVDFDLHKISEVRVNTLVTFSSNLIRKRLGKFNNDSIERVSEMVIELLK